MKNQNITLRFSEENLKKIESLKEMFEQASKKIFSYESFLNIVLAFGVKILFHHLKDKEFVQQLTDIIDSEMNESQNNE